MLIIIIILVVILSLILNPAAQYKTN